MEEFEVDVYDWPGGNTIGKATLKPTGETNVFVAEVRIDAPSKRGWVTLPILDERLPKN